jgi:alpha-amylase
MPALCLYFQVHQPYRLRPFSFFEAGVAEDYFDDSLNRTIMERVASRCYIPAGASLHRALEAYGGALRCSFSISGTAIEQMRDYAPEALGVFKAIVSTGHAEILGETYYHSLASLLPDFNEFRRQVQLHTKLVEREFGVRPRVFRNTELIFSDAIAKEIESGGFSAAIVEGVPDLLAGRTPHAVYRTPQTKLRLLPRDYHLSDLIAFRLFSGRQQGARLTAAEFVRQLRASSQVDDVIFICLDYETFGEHYQGSTGVCDFVEQIAQELLRDAAWRCVTPSQVLSECLPVGDLSFDRPRSWADTTRDVSAWLGNRMQHRAFSQLYSDVTALRCSLEVWGRLQTSDHFYYMSNKTGPDGIVHDYFRSCASPYEAFVAYMNVLRGIELRGEYSNREALP